MLSWGHGEDCGDLCDCSLSLNWDILRLCPHGPFSCWDTVTSWICRGSENLCWARGVNLTQHFLLGFGLLLGCSARRWGSGSLLIWDTALSSHSSWTSGSPFLVWGQSSLSMFLHPLKSLLHLSTTPSLLFYFPSYFFQKFVEFSSANFTFWTTYLPWGTEQRALLFAWVKGKGTMGNSLYSLINMSKDFLATWAKLNTILCRLLGISSITASQFLNNSICNSVPQFPHLQIVFLPTL